MNETKSAAEVGLPILLLALGLACAQPPRSTPTAEMEPFRKFAGTWSVKQTGWFPDPAKPVEFVTDCEISFVLGGRVLQVHEYGGEEVELLGKRGRWEFLGYHSWDEKKRKYINAGFDSFWGFAGLAEGMADGKEKVFTFHLKLLDPDIGNPETTRGVWEWRNEREHVFTLYTAGPDGVEMKLWENVYTRR